MKTTVRGTVVLSADIGKKPFAIRAESGWVTWVHKDGYRFTISNCPIEQFECQNDTQTIELWKSEIAFIAKAIGLKAKDL